MSGLFTKNEVVSCRHVNNVLTDEWLDALEASDILVTGITGQEYWPDAFGNGEAIFESGELSFKIERDRGEDQVSIAFQPRADRFYALDDIRVAFGWEIASRISARTEIPPLPSQLRDVGDNLTTLFERLTGPEAPFWRSRFKDTEEKRRQANRERF